MSGTGREIRFEMLRPEELNDEKKACPLVFVPVGPLEYHGPHLPVGVDPLNATQCALAACRRLGKGVVLPTLYWGTERERSDSVLRSLGFKEGDWVVGMDFPAAIWKSHYYEEQVFALVMASTLEMLIGTGYKVVVIANGHGALNQIETLDRLAKHYSHTTDSLVVWRMAFPSDVLERNLVGHADLYETSLMMFYGAEMFQGQELVKLETLPARDIPIQYTEFSIVDPCGFSGSPGSGRVTTSADPRDATPRMGGQIFEDAVRMYVELARAALREKELA